MAKQGLTEIAVIIDKSGSMSGLKNDIIGGYNEFIKEQRKLDGEAKVTVTLFDTNYEILFNGKDIHEDVFLNEQNYIPGGMTSLLDAVGKTIDEVGARLAKASESKRPEKVIVLVMTDGHENSSKEYKAKMIQEKIGHQRKKYDWEFLFIGADEKSISDAYDYGISMTKGAGGQSVSATMAGDWHGTAGVFKMYMAMNSAVSNYRSVGNVGDWTNVKAQKKEQTKA